MKTFKQFTEEAVPVNSAGAGNIPAIGIGPNGEPPGKMAMMRRQPQRRKKEDEK